MSDQAPTKGQGNGKEKAKPPLPSKDGVPATADAFVDHRHRSGGSGAARRAPRDARDVPAPADRVERPERAHVVTEKIVDISPVELERARPRVKFLGMAGMDDITDADGGDGGSSHASGAPRLEQALLPARWPDDKDEPLMLHFYVSEENMSIVKGTPKPGCSLLKAAADALRLGGRSVPLLELRKSFRQWLLDHSDDVVDGCGGATVGVVLHDACRLDGQWRQYCYKAKIKGGAELELDALDGANIGEDGAANGMEHADAGDDGAHRHAVDGLTAEAYERLVSFGSFTGIGNGGVVYLLAAYLQCRVRLYRLDGVVDINRNARGAPLSIGMRIFGPESQRFSFYALCSANDTNAQPLPDVRLLLAVLAQHPERMDYGMLATAVGVLTRVCNTRGGGGGSQHLALQRSAPSQRTQRYNSQFGVSLLPLHVRMPFLGSWYRVSVPTTESAYSLAQRLHTDLALRGEHYRIEQPNVVDSRRLRLQQLSHGGACLVHVTGATPSGDRDATADDGGAAAGTAATAGAAAADRLSHRRKRRSTHDASDDTGGPHQAAKLPQSTLENCRKLLVECIGRLNFKPKVAENVIAELMVLIEREVTFERWHARNFEFLRDIIKNSPVRDAIKLSKTVKHGRKEAKDQQCKWIYDCACQALKRAGGGYDRVEAATLEAMLTRVVEKPELARRARELIGALSKTTCAPYVVGERPRDDLHDAWQALMTVCKSEAAAAAADAAAGSAGAGDDHSDDHSDDDGDAVGGASTGGDGSASSGKGKKLFATSANNDDTSDGASDSSSSGDDGSSSAGEYSYDDGDDRPLTWTALRDTQGDLLRLARLFGVDVLVDRHMQFAVASVAVLLQLVFEWETSAYRKEQRAYLSDVSILKVSHKVDSFTKVGVVDEACDVLLARVRNLREGAETAAWMLGRGAICRGDRTPRSLAHSLRAVVEIADQTLAKLKELRDAALVSLPLPPGEVTPADKADDGVSIKLMSIDNENGHLHVDEAVLDSLARNRPQLTAKVVTVVGETRMGKSTLINHLSMSDKRLAVAMPTVGHDWRCTTDGVSLFDSHLENVNDPVIFLDVEGHNASQDQHGNHVNPHRLEAVRRLPEQLTPCSEVMIFIMDYARFATTDVKFLADFLRHLMMTRDPSGRVPPTVFIVLNRLPGRDESKYGPMDANELMKTMFAGHEENDLDTLIEHYRMFDVKAYVLPNVTDLRDYDAYLAQVANLRGEIAAVLRERCANVSSTRERFAVAMLRMLKGRPTGGASPFFSDVHSLERVTQESPAQEQTVIMCRLLRRALVLQRAAHDDYDVVHEDEAWLQSIARIYVLNALLTETNEHAEAWQVTAVGRERLDTARAAEWIRTRSDAASALRIAGRTHDLYPVLGELFYELPCAAVKPVACASDAGAKCMLTFGRHLRSPHEHPPSKSSKSWYKRLFARRSAPPKAPKTSAGDALLTKSTSSSSQRKSWSDNEANSPNQWPGAFVSPVAFRALVPDVNINDKTRRGIVERIDVSSLRNSVEEQFRELCGMAPHELFGERLRVHHGAQISFDTLRQLCPEQLCLYCGARDVSEQFYPCLHTICAVCAHKRDAMVAAHLCDDDCPLCCFPVLLRSSFGLLTLGSEGVAHASMRVPQKAAAFARLHAPLVRCEQIGALQGHIVAPVLRQTFQEELRGGEVAAAYDQLAVADVRNGTVAALAAVNAQLGQQFGISSLCEAPTRWHIEQWLLRRAQPKTSSPLVVVVLGALSEQCVAHARNWSAHVLGDEPADSCFRAETTARRRVDAVSDALKELAFQLARERAEREEKAAQTRMKKLQERAKDKAAQVLGNAPKWREATAYEAVSRGKRAAVALPFELRATCCVEGREEPSTLREELERLAKGAFERQLDDKVALAQFLLPLCSDTRMGFLSPLQPSGDAPVTARCYVRAAGDVVFLHYNGSRALATTDDDVYTWARLRALARDLADVVVLSNDFAANDVVSDMCSLEAKRSVLRDGGGPRMAEDNPDSTNPKQMRTSPTDSHWTKIMAAIEAQLAAVRAHDGAANAARVCMTADVVGKLVEQYMLLPTAQLEVRVQLRDRARVLPTPMRPLYVTARLLGDVLRVHEAVEASDAVSRTDKQSFAYVHTRKLIDAVSVLAHFGIHDTAVPPQIRGVHGRMAAAAAANAVGAGCTGGDGLPPVGRLTLEAQRRMIVDTFAWVDSELLSAELGKLAFKSSDVATTVDSCVTAFQRDIIDSLDDAVPGAYEPVSAADLSHASTKPWALSLAWLWVHSRAKADAPALPDGLDAAGTSGVSGNDGDIHDVHDAEGGSGGGADNDDDLVRALSQCAVCQRGARWLPPNERLIEFHCGHTTCTVCVDTQCRFDQLGGGTDAAGPLGGSNGDNGSQRRRPIVDGLHCVLCDRLSVVLIKAYAERWAHEAARVCRLLTALEAVFDAGGDEREPLAIAAVTNLHRRALRYFYTPGAYISLECADLQVEAVVVQRLRTTQKTDAAQQWLSRQRWLLRVHRLLDKQLGASQAHVLTPLEASLMHEGVRDQLHTVVWQCPDSGMAHECRTLAMTLWSRERNDNFLTMCRRDVLDVACKLARLVLRLAPANIDAVLPSNVYLYDNGLECEVYVSLLSSPGVDEAFVVRDGASGHVDTVRSLARLLECMAMYAYTTMSLSLVTQWLERDAVAVDRALADGGAPRLLQRLLDSARQGELAVDALHSLDGVVSGMTVRNYSTYALYHTPRAADVSVREEQDQRALRVESLVNAAMAPVDYAPVYECGRLWRTAVREAHEALPSMADQVAMGGTVESAIAFFEPLFGSVPLRRAVWRLRAAVVVALRTHEFVDCVTLLQEEALLLMQAAVDIVLGRALPESVRNRGCEAVRVLTARVLWKADFVDEERPPRSPLQRNEEGPVPPPSLTASSSSSTASPALPPRSRKTSSQLQLSATGTLADNDFDDASEEALEALEAARDAADAASGGGNSESDESGDEVAIAACDTGTLRGLPPSFVSRTAASFYTVVMKALCSFEAEQSELFERRAVELQEQLAAVANGDMRHGNNERPALFGLLRSAGMNKCRCPCCKASSDSDGVVACCVAASAVAPEAERPVCRGEECGQWDGSAKKAARVPCGCRCCRSGEPCEGRAAKCCNVLSRLVVERRIDTLDAAAACFDPHEKLASLNTVLGGDGLWPLLARIDKPDHPLAILLLIARCKRSLLPRMYESLAFCTYFGLDYGADPDTTSGVAGALSLRRLSSMTLMGAFDADGVHPMPVLLDEPCKAMRDSIETAVGQRESAAPIAALCAMLSRVAARGAAGGKLRLSTEQMELIRTYGRAPFASMLRKHLGIECSVTHGELHVANVAHPAAFYERFAYLGEWRNYMASHEYREVRKHPIRGLSRVVAAIKVNRKRAVEAQRALAARSRKKRSSKK